MGTPMNQAAAGGAPRESAYGHAGVDDVCGALRMEEAIGVDGRVAPWNTRPDRPVLSLVRRRSPASGFAQRRIGADGVSAMAVAPGSKVRIRGE